MADTSPAELKLQKCFSDSWKIISMELKNYFAIVKEGKEHVSLLIAHKTTMKNTEEAKIEDTEVYMNHPNICLRLQHCIEREIHSERTAIKNILNNLQTSFSSIHTQVDKIFNIHRSCNLSLQDITKRSEYCLCFAEKLAALDKFRKYFYQSHIGIKYSPEMFLFDEEYEKILHCWDMSELSTLHQEIDFILDKDYSQCQVGTID